MNWPRFQGQPLLAWLYLAVIAAAWWHNTLQLVAIWVCLCLVWLAVKGSKQTWVFAGIFVVVFASAYWFPLASQLPVPSLGQLAITVVLWSQIITIGAALSMRWLLAPNPGKTTDQKYHQHPLG